VPPLPKELRWVFWEVEFGALDPERDADFILARILEYGRMNDVRWLIRTYGMDRIHEFFRAVGNPELSERTRLFWRAVFHAEEERWATSPDWRRSSSAPWIS
jgi:hypothetical protein